VGKTTIAVNVAALLQIRKGQQVLSSTVDTVTGHTRPAVAGMEKNVRDSRETLLDGGPPTRAWRSHSPRLRHDNENVASRSWSWPSPRSTVEDPRAPNELAEAITTACRVYDWVTSTCTRTTRPLNQVNLRAGGLEESSSRSRRTCRQSGPRCNSEKWPSNSQIGERLANGREPPPTA